MPFATWNVYIDLNDDGDYADAGENISAYVRQLKWSYGCAQAYDPVAKDSTSEIVLRNNDKRFSPESGSVFSANFTVGKKLKIESNNGGTLQTQYVGWIDSIEPTVGPSGARICIVRCTSFFSRVQTVEANVPIQQSAVAEDVIEQIVQAGNVYPPGIGVVWMLGIPGRSELDQTTNIGARSGWLQVLNAGKSTFNYIGDRWGMGVSVLGALRETIMREYGRLILTTGGLLAMYDRHTLLLQATAVSITGASIVDARYSFGKGIINSATVEARPRKVGASPEVLSRLDKSTLIPIGGSLEISFRYNDVTASGVKLGGKNVITPVATTDWTANTKSDGSGVDITSSVSIALISEAATKSVVKFTNNFAGEAWIQSGAQIRGTAIRDFGSVDICVMNNSSITSYGLQPIKYSAPMDNLNDAQALAEYLVYRFGAPKGKLESIDIPANRNATLLNLALSVQPFYLVTVTETQTMQATNYWMIGADHTVLPTKEHRVTWRMEKADEQLYWQLGVTTLSELGQTTTLAAF